MAANPNQDIINATKQGLSKTSGFTPDFHAIFNAGFQPYAPREATPDRISLSSSSTTIATEQLRISHQWIDNNIGKFSIVEMEPYGDVLEPTRGIYFDPIGPDAEAGKKARNPRFWDVLEGVQGVVVKTCESGKEHRDSVYKVMEGQHFNVEKKCSDNVVNRANYENEIKKK